MPCGLPKSMSADLKAILEAKPEYANVGNQSKASAKKEKKLPMLPNKTVQNSPRVPKMRPVISANQLPLSASSGMLSDSFSTPELQLTAATPA